MKSFIESSSGRILAFAVGLAFAGTGVAKLIGPSGLALGAICVFAAISISVVAFATAVNEHFSAAALAVLVMPWLLLLAQVGQSFLTSSGAGYALVITGLAAAAFALRPGTAAARHEAPSLAVSPRIQRN